jgi:hypothetical protein
MSARAARAPFRWFGGKRGAAGEIWSALGDPEHYVEPFAGSLAALLARPADWRRAYHSETVNDLDGLLVNAWRSITLSPDETAEHASWPVCEADLHARHLALIEWRQQHQLEHLMGDARWHDPFMAGWWLWGVACSLGSGGPWCSGRGPWVRGEDGRIARRGAGAAGAAGVTRQLPTLSGDGSGVNRPCLRGPLGGGGLATEPLRAWFRALADRLRWVRIVNGDWRRVCTPGAIETISVKKGGVAGVFLDPPYSAARCGNLYAVDSSTVAHEVRGWCREHGSRKWRIVLAGYAGEHSELEAHGWRVAEWWKGGWFSGGYAVQGAAGTQQHRERLWLSPACLGPRQAEFGW